MKNPEIIAKEHDWLLHTLTGFVGIGMAFVLLPLSLAVLMACTAATSFKQANKLLGHNTRLTNSIIVSLLVIWTSMIIAEQLHLAEIDMTKGWQNYFLVAGFIALALWQLARVLGTKIKYRTSA